MRLVDFHNHFVAPDFPLLPNIDRQLSDFHVLEASLEGIAARVINTPLEFLEDREAGHINDSVAAAVGRHPDRLYGLATVDAYGGEPAARELERAVTQLGLRGLFMESAKDGLLPDAPEARPTFSAAATLGVPVFLHPVADAQLEARFRRFGRMGVRLTRGTINSAALYALLEAGLFETLPRLRVIVTALAFGGVLLAAGLPGGSRLRKDTPPAERRHIYIDTTGMDAVGIRAAIDVVGADHVVLGTDWPVVRETNLPARLQAMFDAWGLDQDARRAIAGGNALGLLSGS